jgi:hypothetical protein
MDYDGIVDRIKSYTNRNEAAFVAIIPGLINQALITIYSEVEGVGFQKVVTGNMVPGIATVQKPQDFKKGVNFQYTVPGATPYTSFLLSRSYEFCITYAPNPLLRGQPLFYSTDLTVPTLSVAAAQLFITPTPDIAYPYQLTYSSMPPLFDARNPQNYLTDRYENLLVYRCLVEAMPYLKSDERLQTYEVLYEKARDNANNDSTGRYTDRVSNREKN